LRAYNGAKHFAGLKITASRTEGNKYPNWKLIRVRKGIDHFLFDRFGETGWSGNGGFHAANLSIQFGATSIILLGFDMSIDNGYHWHGRHQNGLNNPRQATVDKWRISFDAQRPLLDRMGVEVVIGTPHSRLTAFRKLPFLEAIRHGIDRTKRP
jgi:hypothetical protein